MKHKYKITDATKEELIQYFFSTEVYVGGYGYRIPALKDHFLNWLEGKRNKELLSAMDEKADIAQKALSEYVDFIKKANSETDIEKQLEYYEKAYNAYQIYEKANAAYNKIDKKLMG